MHKTLTWYIFSDSDHYSHNPSLSHNPTISNLSFQLLHCTMNFKFPRTLVDTMTVCLAFVFPFASLHFSNTLDSLHFWHQHWHSDTVFLKFDTQRYNTWKLLQGTLIVTLSMLNLTLPCSDFQVKHSIGGQIKITFIHWCTYFYIYQPVIDEMLI